MKLTGHVALSAMTNFFMGHLAKKCKFHPLIRKSFIAKSTDTKNYETCGSNLKK